MAFAILSTVAQEIAKKLSSNIFDGIALWYHVGDELEKLKNTVSRIHAVLLDAEQHQKYSNQDTDWLNKLKDLLYDADDLLDDFSTEALQQRVMTGNKMTKKVHLFFSSSNQLVYGLQMSFKIKSIRERLGNIVKDEKDIKLTEPNIENKVDIWEERQTHSFVLEEEVIGGEKDKEEIIRLLCESNVKENVSVISIVGMGGLGKTTLAQYVFNDERIKSHFDLKMWVCVSDVFEVQMIVEKILESVTKTKPEKLQIDTLQEKLRQQIDGKKYLLVLDDVWNENQEKWDGLMRLLMGGKRESKILLTTRSDIVASIIHTDPFPPYVLKGLSESQSWDLLRKRAFKSLEQESSNSQLVKTGQDIARKCFGVPLLIKTIGGVLHLNKTKMEWSKILNNEHAFTTQLRDGISPILKLSYDHLPSHLKHCFAFCSLFPKDCEIDKQALINLWIAQGFIQSSSENERLEDVGHQYFMDLVWRSFFQELREDREGNVVSCKMHDLMHDFSRSVAGIECAMINSRDKNVDQRVRHVSFDDSLGSSLEIPSVLLKANKIKTLFRPLTRELTCANLNTIVSSCKRLRALDLHGSFIIYFHRLNPDLLGSNFDLLSSNLEKVLRSIDKLKHLRYLDLSRNPCRRMPTSMSEMHNLQTLNLRSCTMLVELPHDIRKMLNLRHLINSGCEMLRGMPKGLGQLTNLQTLSMFIVGKRDYKHRGGLDELKALNNLRGELDIIKLENAIPTESREANLKEKADLQSLILRWYYDWHPSHDDDDDEVILESLQPHPNLKILEIHKCGAVRFPDWLSSLTNIVQIRLWRSYKCEYLPPLDQLPALKILKLLDMRALEWITSDKSYSTSTTFFPSLQILAVFECENLKGWWKKVDDYSSTDDSSTTTSPSSSAILPSFPILSKLYISNCPNFISLPLVPSLEECELTRTSSKVLQKTMKMKKGTATTHSISSSSSSSSHPLSKLKTLDLNNIEDIEFLLEEGLGSFTSLKSLVIKDCPNLINLPVEWCAGLTSLRSLKFRQCRNLKSESGVFQHLSTLEELSIEDCPELQLSSEEGIPSKHLHSLRFLHLRELPQLESPPEWLQYATTLETLQIESFPNLTALPEWIANLTSLQKLDIFHCPKLESLPQGMRRLTTLQRLNILNCSTELEERCKDNMGVDWPLISHIPNISIV